MLAGLGLDPSWTTIHSSDCSQVSFLGYCCTGLFQNHRQLGLNEVIQHLQIVFLFCVLFCLVAVAFCSTLLEKDSEAEEERVK